MKVSIFGFCAAAAVMFSPLVLTGCGGGTMPFNNGGGSSRSAKDEVIKAVQTGFSTYKAGKNSGRSRKGRSEDPNAGVIYDYYYDLWARVGPGGWFVDYFEDEACTKPAGYTRSENTVGENGIDFVSTGAFEINAGPKAGSKGFSSSSLVSSPDTVYTFSYNGEMPGGISWSKSGRWDANGGEFKSSSKDENGKVQRYEASYNNDGTSRLLFTDENGLEFILNFNPGQSGSGTITGDDTTLLPATIEWDDSGSGTITFKDGSKETFENFSFSRG